MDFKTGKRSSVVFRAFSFWSIHWSVHYVVVLGRIGSHSKAMIKEDAIPSVSRKMHNLLAKSYRKRQYDDAFFDNIVAAREDQRKKQSWKYSANTICVRFSSFNSVVLFVWGLRKSDVDWPDYGRLFLGSCLFCFSNIRSSSENNLFNTLWN